MTAKQLGTSLKPRDLLVRIGKCLSFGCDPAQTTAAAGLVRRIARESHRISALERGYIVDERVAVKRLRVASPAAGSESGRSRDDELLAKAWQSGRSDEVYMALAGRVIPRLLRHARADVDTISIPTPEKVTVTNCTTIDPPDTVSIYPRLRLLPTRGPSSPRLLSLRTLIWSHRQMATAALVGQVLDVSGLPGPVLGELASLTVGSTFEPGEANDLTRAVRRLETETWDRADAVEDLGVAGKSG